MGSLDLKADSLRLNGKVAIVTGGSSGIGETTARLFADNGAFVVIADVQDELGLKVVESIGMEKASYKRCDVKDEKQVEEMVAFTLQKYSSLDILFSNAGIMGDPKGILELDMEAFDNTMAVNVRGAAHTMKHVARVMVEKNIRGSIICTASVASSLGGCGGIAYTASKHGLIGLVKSVCCELGAHGIRVNSISPFGVATPLICQPENAAQMEEAISAYTNLKGAVLKTRHIAETALFLASDESAYISGQDIAVDGGFSVVRPVFK